MDGRLPDTPPHFYKPRYSQPTTRPADSPEISPMSILAGRSFGNMSLPQPRYIPQILSSARQRQLSPLDLRQSDILPMDRMETPASWHIMSFNAILNPEPVEDAAAILEPPTPRATAWPPETLTPIASTLLTPKTGPWSIPSNSDVIFSRMQLPWRTAIERPRNLDFRQRYTDSDPVPALPSPPPHHHHPTTDWLSSLGDAYQRAFGLSAAEWAQYYQSLIPESDELRHQLVHQQTKEEGRVSEGSTLQLPSEYRHVAPDVIAWRDGVARTEASSTQSTLPVSSSPGVEPSKAVNLGSILPPRHKRHKHLDAIFHFDRRRSARQSRDSATVSPTSNEATDGSVTPRAISSPPSDRTPSARASSGSAFGTWTFDGAREKSFVGRRSRVIEHLDGNDEAGYAGNDELSD